MAKGRPHELTPKVAERVIAATAKGLTRKVAARCAGIAPSTLFDWLERGRSGEQPFAEFSERVKEAESTGEESLVDLIREHAVETWQAGAWLLERRYPDRYALKHKVQHEVKFTEAQARAKFRELTGKDWGEE